MSEQTDVAIIGGGIIGTSLALALQNEGVGVTLCDPDGAGRGAAVGSASYISVGEIFPLAHPSLLFELPKMLLDPLGPLVIRPSYLPALVPWGLRFLAAMRPPAVRRNTAALASLNRNAVAALSDLATLAGAERYLDYNGGLLVCEHEKTLRSVAPQVEMLQSFGIGARLITSSELHELEPSLAQGLAGAILFPDSARCTDPLAFSASLAVAAVARGARILRERVTRIEPQPNGVFTIHAAERFTARRVVVTAGVWSGRLLSPLGYRVPVETERGYHLMLPEPGVTVRRPMVFQERHFCVTGLDNGIRLAGTVEFAGTGAPMNPHRSDVLYDLAKHYLPGIEKQHSTRWMGFRPSLPDSLPAMGRGSKYENLFYCFGHQHLGLTQAGISAKAMAALIVGRDPAIDLTPFRIERFGGTA